MLAFQKDISKFEGLDAQVLGASRDSVQTLQEFNERYGIPFPLISDESGEIRSAYGRGRVTYLIDKAGVIQYIQKGVPKNEDFLKELEKLKE